MNSSKPTTSFFIKLKYFFYSSLLKINSDNRKFIREKIFYGSLLITTGAGLLYGCNMASCHKVRLSKPKEDSLIREQQKDSVLKAKSNEKLKVDSLKQTNSIKADSITKHK